MADFTDETYYIENDNFKKSDKDQRFKRTNRNTKKPFRPTQLVIRPNYPNDTILHQELMKNGIVQLKNGKFYRILTLTEYPIGTFPFGVSHVDESQYRGTPLNIESNLLEDIAFTVVEEDGDVRIDKAQVHMVWRGTVPWKTDVREEAWWITHTTPIQHRRGPLVVCSNPPFDDYVHVLGHTVLDNTTARTHTDYPYAIDMANQYSEFIGLMPQVHYVNEVQRHAQMETREGINKSVLAAYVTNSDAFNKTDSKYIDYIERLDTIFKNSPPLTTALTVFRKYENPPEDLDRLYPGNLFISDRYVSTSLSLSYLKNASFLVHDGESTSPIYCRIDIMPGVHVLPVYDWHGFKSDRVMDTTDTLFRNVLTEIEKSQFEIILPRNTRLYKLPDIRTIGTDKIPELTILKDERVKGGEFPTITHHFVAVADDYEEFELQYPHSAYLPWSKLKLDDGFSTVSIPINITTSELIYEKQLAQHSDRTMKEKKLKQSTVLHDRHYKQAVRTGTISDIQRERESQRTYRKRTLPHPYTPSSPSYRARSRSRDKYGGKRKTRRFRLQMPCKSIYC